MVRSRPPLTRNQGVYQQPTSSTSKQVTQSRRPLCTHTTMNRLYGEHTCHQCGKVPTLGWVYSCQQDHLSQIRSNGTSTEILPLVPDHGNYFEAQAEIGKSLGMSASIIRQMRAGEYCYEQMETLLAQRRRVKEVIRQAEGTIPAAGLGIAPAVQQVAPSLLPMTPAGTPYNSASNSPKKSPKKSKCNFQVCHACRPCIQDRLPMSVESVLYNEIPPVTEAEMAKLPVLNSNIMRNIGLLESPPESTMLHSQQEDVIRPPEGNVSEESTPTTATSSWSVSTEDLVADGDPTPCPGTADHRFAPEDGADHPDRPSPSYRRIHRMRGSVTNTPSGSSSTGSSVSLPDALTAPLTPVTPSDPRFGFSFLGESRFGKKAGRAATICGDMSDERKRGREYHPFGIFGRDSNSSFGSEVEVEGGLALTEEAVETGMPDIGTDDE